MKIKKIFIVHNCYKQKGGEDIVVNLEAKLLRKNGHKVRRIYFYNKNISSFKEKFLISIYSTYNIYTKKFIEKEIKKFFPDIIHVHNFFPVISPSVFFVAKKYNIPIVLTLHNFRLICPCALLFDAKNICEKCIDKPFPYPAILKRCYKNSFVYTFANAFIFSLHKWLGTWKTKIDKFITLTNFQKKKFLESSLNIPEEKFVVKPNFCEDYGFNLNRKDFFIFIGRLSEEKGIKILLEAAKYLKFKLKIVGDGPLRKFVENHARTNKNIKYLGFKKKEEVINLMKTAKALLFPSLCYEGYPMVLVEALSTGTPVITSNIGSQAAIIENGKTGLYFKVGDAIDLARKIEIFLKLNKKEFYINARKTYLKKYTPEKNYEQLIKIYNEVISAKNKEVDNN